MRPVTALIVALTMALAFSVTDANAETEVYRWVDENGVVHFGDRPSAQQASEIVDIPKSPEVTPQSITSQSPADTPEQQALQPSYAEQKRKERAEKRREAAQKKQKLDLECAHNQQLVDSLEPTPRVLIRNADGSVDRMDDNDRMQRLGAAKSFLAANCD